MVGKQYHVQIPSVEPITMSATSRKLYLKTTLFFALFFIIQNNHAETSTLHVTILSYQDIPVEGVIVNASPLDSAKPIISEKNTVYKMVQKDRVFSPNILAIQAGEYISFPNQDAIKHHVYSFSKPKVFQLKLYKDRVPEPVLFDKPGIVSVGCNIHDWMVGHIYIADSPYFNTTNNKGITEIPVPNAEYKIQFWHPLISAHDLKKIKEIDIQNDTKLTFNLNHALAKPPKRKSSNKFWRNY